ncbi:hypothetical protein EYF80_000842 [Liparis tanakae]|uniref:Uncharacterized protein n=1 Tax=Liparis tanakae TaxID=230148 RepID=A0A4Z2JGU2_9TELE|nr:hypothetical protein EYF80_000842 [Liparis tanakae]
MKLSQFVMLHEGHLVGRNVNNKYHDQSSLGVERDLTRGRGGGPCCLASRRCGKIQTGSSKDSQRALPRTDGVPNPWRFLKAMHDRGGGLQPATCVVFVALSSVSGQALWGCRCEDRPGEHR